MYVSHLESAIDGTKFLAGSLQTTHNNKPIWVRYDLVTVGKKASKAKLRERDSSLWRYRELLPLPESARVISLGEIITPLLKADSLGKEMGLQNLWIKDESRLPTGSFKSRGMAIAMSMAKHLGVKKIALPTAGNAGAAAAAYARAANIEAYVFMPDDTPIVNQAETHLFGAKVFLVNGLITECGKIVREGSEKFGWFNLSTLNEPYRIEGKKTMGLELAEQFDWKLPDVIIYPTGGGTGLIGMWKGFKELRELGWLESDKLPRMVAVQSDGCCPIVRAFEQGERFAEPFQNAHTVASGLRVPSAVGDFMILDSIKESGGMAVAVDENKILDWMKFAHQQTGLSICPEAAACVGALKQLANENWIRPAESIVIFNTASGTKYLNSLNIQLQRIDIKKGVDWNLIES